MTTPTISTRIGTRGELLRSEHIAALLRLCVEDLVAIDDIDPGDVYDDDYEQH